MATVTIDQLAHRTGVVPTHLKIDVEGAEIAVLRGAPDVLSQRRPFVSLELHNAILRRAGRDPGAVVTCLEGYGYRVDDVEAGHGLSDETFEREVSRLVAWPSTE